MVDDPNYKSPNWSDESKRVMRTEISQFFLDGMISRMLVSHDKYGPVANAYPEKLDALSSARERINLYRKTGNTEYLMDAANFMMIEFMHPSKEDAFFQGTDDSGSPGRVSRETRQATKKSNEQLSEAA